MTLNGIRGKTRHENAKLIAYKTLESSHGRGMEMHSKCRTWNHQQRRHAGEQNLVQDRDNTRDVSDRHETQEY